MYTCPACGAEDVSGQNMCRCGADLTLLLRIDGMADAWFNRALEALAKGKPGRALEWLAACCAVRPADVAAQRALAQVWAQLGRWAEAQEALARAQAVDPDAPGLPELEQALQQSQVTQPTMRRKARAGSSATRPQHKSS